jgi:hypothetical protein
MQPAAMGTQRKVWDVPLSPSPREGHVEADNGAGRLHAPECKSARADALLPEEGKNWIAAALDIELRAEPLAQGRILFSLNVTAATTAPPLARRTGRRR